MDNLTVNISLSLWIDRKSSRMAWWRVKGPCWSPQVCERIRERGNANVRFWWWKYFGRSPYWWQRQLLVPYVAFLCVCVRMCVCCNGVWECKFHREHLLRQHWSHRHPGEDKEKEQRCAGPLCIFVTRSQVSLKHSRNFSPKVQLRLLFSRKNGSNIPQSPGGSLTDTSFH